jgi:hypothetical protein
VKFWGTLSGVGLHWRRSAGLKGVPHSDDTARVEWFNLRTTRGLGSGEGFVLQKAGGGSSRIAESGELGMTMTTDWSRDSL